MNYSLNDKVVVVTGGASGIGFQIVDKYLEQEAKVAIILDINETQGKKAITSLTEKHGDGKAEFIKCDVTTDLDITANTIFAKYKTVDVLVLNAGTADPTIPRKFFDILTTSVIEWSMKFVEYMAKDKRRHGGTILMNSSIFGLRNIPYAPVYQASKYAIVGFAKSLGHNYNFQKTGVRVLAICPGFTETNLTLPLYDQKLKVLNPNQDLVKFASTHSWQKAEVVGKAAVAIFEKAESGTIWIIEGGKLTQAIEN